VKQRDRNENRVQGRVSAYQKWVIDRLVGIEGRSPSDVVARILGSWIEEREEWLGKRGISLNIFNEAFSRKGEAMNTATVFYSWQSDRDPRITRSFIEQALKKAVRTAGEALHLDLILDQDARGESGSPMIPDVIQQKIRKAAVFVGDLTIVAKRDGDRGGLPNGCVLVEWGWAEEALGSLALVGVMNRSFGGPGDLPIDIRQFLVRATYTLDPAASSEQRMIERDQLGTALTGAIIEAVRSRFFRGMHPEAPAVVKFLITLSSDGRWSDDLGVEEVADGAGVSRDLALATMEDLVRFGLASEGGYAGSGFMIRIGEPLCAHFDPLYMGWNADQDAEAIARELVRQDWVNVESLARELAWSARRLNPALFRLLQGQFADASSQVPGASPFSVVDLSKNTNTRALAERRASLPPIAPRAHSHI
jgi:hypothetical protein